MPEAKPAAPEDRLRQAIADTVQVVEKLFPKVKNVDDLLPILRLALENDGQLRLLMSDFAPLSQR